MVTLNFIRKHAVVLSALAIAGTTLMSFEFNSKKMEETKFADPYWKFVGSANPSIPDNPHDPSQYNSATESESCDGSTTVCLIQAPNNSGQPNLNAMVGTSGQTVQEQIDDAIENSATNETVRSFQDL